MINCRECRGKGWKGKLDELNRRRSEGEEIMIPSGMVTTYKTESVPRVDIPRYIIRYHLCYNCGARFKSIQKFHEMVNTQNEFNLEDEQ